MKEESTEDSNSNDDPTRFINLFTNETDRNETDVTRINQTVEDGKITISVNSFNVINCMLDVIYEKLSLNEPIEMESTSIPVLEYMEDVKICKYQNINLAIIPIGKTFD